MRTLIASMNDFSGKLILFDAPKQLSWIELTYNNFAGVAKVSKDFNSRLLLRGNKISKVIDEEGMEHQSSAVMLDDLSDASSGDLYSSDED